MSYTVKIKEEISTIKSTKSELIAELSAYIRNNGTITKKEITLPTENYFLVERVTNTIKYLYDINVKIEKINNLNFSKKTLYQVINQPK